MEKTPKALPLRTVTQIGQADIQEMRRLLVLVLDELQAADGQALFDLDQVVSVCMKAASVCRSKPVQKLGRLAWEYMISKSVTNNETARLLFRTVTAIIERSDGSIEVRCPSPTNPMKTHTLVVPPTWRTDQARQGG
jgi:hypothetical protein